MRFGQTAGIVVGIGMMGAIIFGIWLAIDVDGYELWDPWILASIVIWAISGSAGGQAGKAFASGLSGRQAGIRYQAINSVGLFVILLLMIWKPGREHARSSVRTITSALPARLRGDAPGRDCLPWLWRRVLAWRRPDDAVG
jgi:hypothetical protein